MYQCTACGEHTLVPTDGDTGIVQLECPGCGADELMSVDDKCRNGRTTYLSADDEPCWNDWQEENLFPDEPHDKVPEGQFKLCNEHYEARFTFELPDGAIGRCISADCNHAVFSKSEGKLLCEACE